MGWPLLVAAGVSALSALSSDKKAGEANAQSIGLQQDSLNFAKEQYNRWKEIYGPIERNVADFYDTLTPEFFSSQGLQQYQKQSQQALSNMEEHFALAGVESGVQTDIRAKMELQGARDKAQIRYEAPIKVAQAKEGFIAAGRGQQQAGAAGVINQTNNLAGAFGNEAIRQGRNSAAAWQGFGDVLTAGIQEYNFNQFTKTAAEGSTEIG